MANIKDVAAVAGVSVTTVSRVMNDRGYISDKTKKKVHDAMEQLNYHPNELATSFFRQKTNLVGLILPDVSINFYAELTKYIEQYLYEKGYKLMLCNAYSSHEREKEYINMLQRNKVDGIIIGSHTLEIEDYLKINSPIVALDRNLGENIPTIYADHTLGGTLAANHLIQCGCKNIVQFSGSSHLKSTTNERHRTVELVLKEQGIQIETIEMELNTFSNEQNLQYINLMFDNHQNIDGVFATDNMAILIIKEAYKRGIKVPQDLKVIGYDGTENSQLFIPSLTTIKQPLKEICIDAVDKLLALIDNPEMEIVDSKLGVELIEGETT